ncbi:MAG: glycosyltransferase family 2 protein [Acidimicrobiales bacterium]
MFFDADDEPNSVYVASHLKVLAGRDEPAATFARLTPDAFGQIGDVRVGLSTLQDDGPNSVFNRIPWAGAGSLGLPRSVFDQLGGFESAMIGAEDIEFCIRMWKAGIPLVAAPNAVCRIRTRESPRAVFRQRKAYAIAHVAIARAHWPMQDPIRFAAAQVKALMRVPAILFSAAYAYLAGGSARFEAADAVGSLVGYLVGSLRYRRLVFNIWGNSLRR